MSAWLLLIEDKREQRRMHFNFSVITSNSGVLLGGLAATVLFCFAALLIGLPLGVLVAFGRISREAWLNVPAAIFVEVIRDTPFLVQAYIIFFALPAFGVSLTPVSAGILALSLYGAAYFSESIRGAILSVPKGQMDAARATGMSYLLAMRRIIFPQMMAYLIPPLTNQLIGLVKDSSVLATIATPELTMATQTVLGNTFAAIEAYSAAAVLYWVLTAALAALMGRLERRTHTYRLRALEQLAAQQLGSQTL